VCRIGSFAQRPLRHNHRDELLFKRAALHVCITMAKQETIDLEGYIKANDQ
jgi:hypothetical protein